MKKKEKRHSYWAYFRKNKIVVAFLLTAIATSASFAGTHLLSQFVDKISSKNFNNIVMLVVSLLFIEVGSYSLSWLTEKIIVNLKANIKNKMSAQLLRAIAESSAESVLKNDAVALAASCEDASCFVDAVHSIYGEVFNLCLGIAALIYTVLVSWQLAVLLIISFVVILLVQYFTIKKMVVAQKIARVAAVSTKALLVQAIQSFVDFKVQRLSIKTLVYNSLENEKETNVKAEEVRLNTNLLSKILASFVQTMFLCLSVALILGSVLDLGEFVALFMYKGYVFGLVGAILHIARSKAQIKTAADRMDAILNSDIVYKEEWGTIRLKDPSGEIDIKDLVVKYGNTTVIDHLSVTLPAGKVIGIVGESGAGKSTLLKVLAKVEKFASGSIKMNNVELSDLTENSFRRAIVMAQQTPFLFDLTIKENLLLANPEASDGAIWDALKETAADKFVLEKGGLDAVITPKELSGGQRQRLALARLVLRGGKVILLDEATSALDGESQAIVIDAIKKASSRGHTMVLVAHRVSSLKDADMIVHMENGRVLETGTYAELYEKSEKFRRLADLG